MTIVSVEPLSVDKDVLDHAVQRFADAGHQFIIYQDRPGSQKETAMRIRDADAAVITDLPLPRGVIEKTKKLKLVVVAFPNDDHVDMEACSERGVQVSHIEGYSAFAVAELAVSMMISLLRSMITANNAMRTGNHDLPYLGEELHKKTVGIIGLGDVGIQAAKMVSAMDCPVIAYDPLPVAEAYQTGVTYVPLEQLFREADILSIHCPLTPQTEGMVTYDLLSMMKPTSFIINVGRSPVIDLDGLIRALREKKIAGAGLDTQEKSRMEADHTLLTFDNVIITPHIGFRTKQSFERRLLAIEKRILEWIESQSG